MTDTTQQNTNLDEKLRQGVDSSNTVMAHAWMVRTFVKHSDEVEDFPELMQVVRTVFDTARALETRIDDPKGYFKMLRKKFSKLQKAAEQFRHDAPLASDHTNFKQAVASLDGCVAAWKVLLESAEVLIHSDSSDDTSHS